MTTSASSGISFIDLFSTTRSGTPAFSALSRSMDAAIALEPIPASQAKMTLRTWE
jgi:16S rRNA G966 N2-methylase RsmD